MLKALKKSFYINNPTDYIAKNLVGKILERKINGQTLLFRIIETEAYLGLNDPSAHSYHGRLTNRTRIMYENGGVSYVYLIYGMYFCFNIITNTKDHPEAVLIRALEPLNNELRTNGPGLIGNSLEFNLSHNGIKVYDKNSEVVVYDDSFKDFEIVTTTRIGLSHSEGMKMPLRYYLKGSKYVSKGKFYK